MILESLSMDLLLMVEEAPTRSITGNNIRLFDRRILNKVPLIYRAMGISCESVLEPGEVLL
jgi:hypothetical protein